MRKFILFILAIVIVFTIWINLSKSPSLRGFYQAEVNGYHIQMLIRERDGIFVEWIDNREVDRGTFKKVDTNLYSFVSDRQSFEIKLNDDNSYEIFINKLNDVNPIIMKNITSKDHWVGFGEFDDIDKYKALLD